MPLLLLITILSYIIVQLEQNIQVCWFHLHLHMYFTIHVLIIICAVQQEKQLYSNFHMHTAAGRHKEIILLDLPNFTKTKIFTFSLPSVQRI